MKCNDCGCEITPDTMNRRTGRTDVCNELDVPYFSCRGYTSQSEMWTAAVRLIHNLRNQQAPIILHFGDHDPSGKDMSRDIRDRLTTFIQHHLDREFGFERLALNFDQVEQYNPPPNPTKLSDSRAEGYIAEFGGECWELDALEPQVIADLARAAIVAVRDEVRWFEAEDEERAQKERLSAIADRYDDIADSLDE